MKNLFKFGFLGLALALAVAACGGSETKTEETADTTVEVVPTPDDTIEVVTDTVVTTDTLAEDTDH
ncbi:hypothetical protein [Olivibacter sitiensis]|uniref:hypothetical protein n=1 Tax=Olivibacter sitiensis TaxID=376470 RepID=UPI00047F08B2|nr:hypothetical protein [Olivibacter sitiensis]